MLAKAALNASLRPGTLAVYDAAAPPTIISSARQVPPILQSADPEHRVRNAVAQAEKYKADA